ncbi:MAG TPA: DoxX family membrane protein, partial [Thermoanaerobaculia bacterium]|nr:DoxX family membrane protein [Thermoanaerobaculia bacterium]
MSTTQPSLNLDSLYRPLWLTYGLVPLLAGLDKFFNLLTDWPKYLSPWMANLLPVPAETFMYAVGVIEIGVGLMVLTRWTRLGAWIAAAWLV